MYRLRDAPAADDREGCPTPFVYLYEVSGNNGDRYTYPETRRALSSFPDASEIELVEFREGVPRLGVVVPTTTVSAESVESVEIVETFCSCELR